MKKMMRWTLLVIVVVFAFALTACGGKTDGGDEVPTPPSFSAQVEGSILSYTCSVTPNTVKFVINNTEHTMTSTSFDLATLNLSNGKYTIVINAMANNQEYSAQCIYTQGAPDKGERLISVIFRDSKGGEIKELYKDYGTILAESDFPPLFSTVGYTYAWDTESGIELTESITILMTATLNTYKITYNVNGGTLPFSVIATFTIKDTNLTLPIPSHESKVFDGWYENEQFSGSAVASFSGEIAVNKTFYAKWRDSSSEELALRDSIRKTLALKTYTMDIRETNSSNLQECAYDESGTTPYFHIKKNNVLTEMLSQSTVYDYVNKKYYPADGSDVEVFKNGLGLSEILVVNFASAVLKSTEGNVKIYEITLHGQDEVWTYRCEGEYVTEVRVDLGNGNFGVATVKRTVSKADRPDTSGWTETFFYKVTVYCGCDDHKNQGGSVVMRVERGNKILDLREKHRKERDIIEGIYTNAEFSQWFDLTGAVYSNLTLYIKWGDPSEIYKNVAFNLEFHCGCYLCNGEKTYSSTFGQFASHQLSKELDAHIRSCSGEDTLYGNGQAYRSCYTDASFTERININDVVSALRDEYDKTGKITTVPKLYFKGESATTYAVHIDCGCDIHPQGVVCYVGTETDHNSVIRTIKHEKAKMYFNGYKPRDKNVEYPPNLVSDAYYDAVWIVDNRVELTFTAGNGTLPVSFKEFPNDKQMIRDIAPMLNDGFDKGVAEWYYDAGLTQPIGEDTISKSAKLYGKWVNFVEVTLDTGIYDKQYKIKALPGWDEHRLHYFYQKLGKESAFDFILSLWSEREDYRLYTFNWFYDAKFIRPVEQYDGSTTTLYVQYAEVKKVIIHCDEKCTSDHERELGVDGRLDYDSLGATHSIITENGLSVGSKYYLDEACTQAFVYGNSITKPNEDIHIWVKFNEYYSITIHCDCFTHYKGDGSSNDGVWILDTYPDADLLSLIRGYNGDNHLHDYGMTAGDSTGGQMPVPQAYYDAAFSDEVVAYTQIKQNYEIYLKKTVAISFVCDCADHSGKTYKAKIDTDSSNVLQTLTTHKDYVEYIPYKDAQYFREAKREEIKDGDTLYMTIKEGRKITFYIHYGEYSHSPEEFDPREGYLGVEMMTQMPWSDVTSTDPGFVFLGLFEDAEFTVPIEYSLDSEWNYFITFIVHNAENKIKNVYMKIVKDERPYLTVKCPNYSDSDHYCNNKEEQFRIKDNQTYGELLNQTFHVQIGKMPIFVRNADGTGAIDLTSKAVKGTVYIGLVEDTRPQVTFKCSCNNGHIKDHGVEQLDIQKKIYLFKNQISVPSGTDIAQYFQYIRHTYSIQDSEREEIDLFINLTKLNLYTDEKCTQPFTNTVITEDITIYIVFDQADLVTVTLDCDCNKENANHYLHTLYADSWYDFMIFSSDGFNHHSPKPGYKFEGIYKDAAYSQLFTKKDAQDMIKNPYTTTLYVKYVEKPHLLIDCLCDNEMCNKKLDYESEQFKELQRYIRGGRVYAFNSQHLVTGKYLEGIYIDKTFETKLTTEKLDELLREKPFASLYFRYEDSFSITVNCNAAGGKKHEYAVGSLAYFDFCLSQLHAEDHYIMEGLYSDKAFLHKLTDKYFHDFMQNPTQTTFYVKLQLSPIVIEIEGLTSIYPVIRTQEQREQMSSALETGDFSCFYCDKRLEVYRDKEKTQRFTKADWEEFLENSSSLTLYAKPID